MSENATLVELSNVTKTYRMGETSLTALDRVSLRIARGEFVAIVGPSGSGKSTLLNLITGIDKPTQGTVRIGDIVINRLNEDELARWRGENIGLVFQFFQLLPTLTAVENVILPMHFRGTYGETRRQRARALLERVGVGGRANHLPAELSGGEQQRVAIARALANDPPLFLADEPTGNLDTDTATHIVELISDIHAQGKTVILITHEMFLASAAQRVIRLEDGHIAADHIQETASV
jgi:putative ABC transport system ATP-binding protein